MMVSEVGRTTSGSSSFSPPACVTTATSGANPSMCSASFSSKREGMNIGKYRFWCPVALIRSSTARWMASQIPKPYGLMTIVPRAREFSANPACFTTSWYQAGKSSDCVGRAMACQGYRPMIDGHRSSPQNLAHDDAGARDSSLVLVARPPGAAARPSLTQRQDIDGPGGCPGAFALAGTSRQGEHDGGSENPPG